MTKQIRNQSRLSGRHQLDPLEPRHCLSAVSFLWHPLSDSGGLEWSDVAASDWDADGDVDVIAVGTKGLVVFEDLDGRQTFSPAKTLDDTGVYHEVQTADMDGDSTEDVIGVRTSRCPVIERPCDGTLVWLKRSEQDSQPTAHLIAVANSDHFPESAGSGFDPFDIVDFDRDGDVDILRNRDWLENRRDGVSFVAHALPEDIFALWVQAGDLDGDTDLDILRPPIFGSGVNWLRNADGQGISWELMKVSGTQALYRATMGDVDGDGDLDIVEAAFNSHSGGRGIAWRANLNGMGEFGPPQAIELRPFTCDGCYLFELTTADIDVDGDLDVLVAAPHVVNGLVWYENEGLGQFGEAQHIGSVDIGAVVSVPIALRDIDGDGDIDVVTEKPAETFGAERLLGWYENRRFGDVGDVNHDDSFDRLDVVAMLAAGKFLTGELATWEEGDFNRDGVFNEQDIVKALQAANYAASDAERPTDALFATVELAFFQ